MNITVILFSLKYSIRFSISIIERANLDSSVTINASPDRVAGSNWINGPNYNRWFKFQATTPEVSAELKTGAEEGTLDYGFIAIFNEDDIEFKHDIRDNITRLDAGLSGGVGYKFEGTGMNLGITYYYGLVDIDKTDLHSRNSSFYLYVDIPIGAGYKKDKESE